MDKNFKRMLQGYQDFRKRYASSDQSVMQQLSQNGQNPEVMVVACCDSRVDPALILQCDPGDLFVVRNVANIVPPYEKDEMHHGTSAALEFGVRVLNVKHLILLGHSQCGGILSLMDQQTTSQNDFVSNWVSLIKITQENVNNSDDYAKLALNKSYQNCLTFPWIKDKVNREALIIHLWFFDIQMGEVFTYCDRDGTYQPLD